MTSDQDRSTTPTLSVVAPVYREEAVIAKFISRCRAALESLELPNGWELLLVDDGSPDKSMEQMRAAASLDHRIKVVRLSRNFGHQAAITAGVDHARGSAVVLIDSDLQDPPETIAAMVEEWRAGADVVYGVRASRLGESRFKIHTARLFYRLLGRLSDTPLSTDSGDFRLLDQRVVQALRSMREENRYLRGMVSWVGFNQVAVHYARDARTTGRSAYSLGRMLRLAMDGITGFSDRPLQLATQLGSVITATSFGYLVWIIVATIVRPSHSVAGFTSLMCALLFLGGVQLLSIGLLGQYVGRIFREVKRRPLYVVTERVNVDDTAV